jgi:hypothetical protein
MIILFALERVYGEAYTLYLQINMQSIILKTKYIIKYISHVLKLYLIFSPINKNKSVWVLLFEMY